MRSPLFGITVLPKAACSVFTDFLSGLGVLSSFFPTFSATVLPSSSEFVDFWLYVTDFWGFSLLLLPLGKEKLTQLPEATKPWRPDELAHV